MKVFCLKCRTVTNHSVAKEYTKTYEQDDVWAEGTYQIIECNGCEEVSFRETWVNSEDVYVPDDADIAKLYPVRNEDTISIKSFYNVPYKIRNIYREMIDAFNNGLFTLCAGGLRTIIEGICNNKGVLDGPVETERNGTKLTLRKRNLQGKISGLSELGHLTKNHSEILQEHRFLGNEALHSLDKPTVEELKIAIEIVEHTLDNLYELNEKIGDFRDMKIKRKNRGQ